MLQTDADCVDHPVSEGWHHSVAQSVSSMSINGQIAMSMKFLNETKISACVRACVRK